MTGILAVGRAQGDADIQRIEPAAEGQVMLFGKDLGGGHQRGLTPRIDGQQHGRHGDKGFAGAHIALQQSVHRPRLAHVRNDLLDGTLLRVC